MLLCVIIAYVVYLAKFMGPANFPLPLQSREDGPVTPWTKKGALTFHFFRLRRKRKTLLPLPKLLLHLSRTFAPLPLLFKLGQGRKKLSFGGLHFEKRRRLFIQLRPRTFEEWAESCLSFRFSEIGAGEVLSVQRQEIDINTTKFIFVGFVSMIFYRIVFRSFFPGRL